MVLNVAQYNIARLKGPAALLPGFLDEVARVNALGDKAPGFLYRYEVSDGNSLAETVRDGMIINLTVWDSVEALYNFTFKGAHLEMLQRRADWFEPKQMTNILWFTVYERVTLAEAEGRMDGYLNFGSHPSAFTWKDIKHG